MALVRRRAKSELQRANRALRTINACNRALIRATREADLVTEVCRVIVEEGGYRLAWVGYAENDEHKTVRPVACAGYEAGYLERVAITWADEPRGRGPTGTAIRTRRPAVCRDMLTDPEFAPWRADAVQRGYAASIVVPLLTKDAVLGAISIYAVEAGAFDRAEVALLRELADDLVYGLQALRAREAQRVAEAALQRAGDYNRRLLEASLDPLVTIGPEGRITDVNAATESATGCSRTELIGTDFSDYFTAPEQARAGYQQVFRDGSVRDYPLELRHRDGRTAAVLYNASVYRDERGAVIGVFAAARDVTRRNRAEDVLRRSEAELREAQRVAHVGSWRMDAASGEVTWTEELHLMFGLDPRQPPPPYPEHRRLFAPESWARLDAALRRTQETGTPYELELEMIRADGTSGWMLARGEPLRDGGGGIVGLRGSAQDITARRRAEEALKESEQAFRALAELVPQMVWATRADGWNIYFNQRWLDYTGMTLEESHGHGWNIPFHPEDRQRAWDAWQRATQQGTLYSLEARLRRKDGVYRWWLVRGEPQRDAAGKIVKWFGTCTDIQDLKEAEQQIRDLNAHLEQRVLERTRELAESEERLRLVLEASTMGTFEIDLVTGDGRWNDVEFALLGLKPGEAPAGPATFLRYVHPDDLEEFRRRWEEAKLTGRLDLEFRVVRADGEVRWLAGKGHFAYAHRADASSGEPWGQPLRFLGVNFDITERKLAEQARRDSEQQLALAVEAAHAGIWNWDVATGRLSWSAPLFQMFGLEPAGATADFDTWRRVMHPADRDAAEAKVRTAVEAHVRLENEYRIVLPSGEVRWISALGDTRYDAAGRPLQMSGVCLDVTARKRTELELRNLAAELQAANKELEAFSYSVSHDLRAPLRSIDGFSRILLEDCAGKLAAEERDHLQRVRAASQRMGELIDDLLALSRTARIGMQCVPVDLSGLAAAAFAQLRAAEPARAVECLVAPGLRAVADPSLLRVVLDNLLGNAWKFTARRPDARIEFGATPGGADPAFYVRDNGSGFDPAYAGKLFTPFQRLHTQEEFPGHGIGLATVQRIIRRHGGRVWAEGRSGEGAVFHFTLPGNPETS